LAEIRDRPRAESENGIELLSAAFARSALRIADYGLRNP
jgi:hypothetical protein